MVRTVERTSRKPDAALSAILGERDGNVDCRPGVGVRETVANGVFANNATNDVEIEGNIPDDFRRVIRYLRGFERPKRLTRKKYLQFQ